MKLSLFDIVLTIICFFIVVCLLLLKYIYPDNELIIKYLSGAPQFFIIITLYLHYFVLISYFEKRSSV